MKRRVAVTGTGIITAHGIGKDINLKKLKDAVDSTGIIAAFNSEIYRGRRGGEVRDFIYAHPLKHLKPLRLDRASHLLIHATREALSDSHLEDKISEKEVFVSLGTTLGGMISGERYHAEILKKGINRARLSWMLDYLAQYQAFHLFREFNLEGQFMVFSNACASGTNAIGAAFNAVRFGEAGIAIAAGYDTMSEFTFAGFNSLMAVTPEVCRPFDKNRNGLILGEGAGVLVLEELESALARGADIIAEVIGYGESADAYHLTSPDPEGTGAAGAMAMALKDAGISGEKIDYINAHGTGTPYNDIMEARAIKKVFGELAEKIFVSSTKPMVGHLLGGAGAVEAIFSIMAIKNSFIPVNLNCALPDPECGLNIAREPVSADIKTIMSNSFGFGGSNASIILREYR